MENSILTPEEVAEILKITKNTVYELIKRNELVAYKVGNKVRVDKSDLTEYIEKSKGSQNKFQTTDTGFQAQNNNNVLRIAGKANQMINNQQLIICGQDQSLDILANMIAHHPLGIQVLRSYVGSYAGLVSLYHDQCQISATHLWDGDSNGYNTPYVRRLVPGVSCVIIHIGKRKQGYYVAKGNPKKINGMSDLIRSDVTLINREKGSGSRVLLDEHLSLLGMSCHDIIGYENEETSHLAVASGIARGKADVGIGCESVAKSVSAIDFVPIQNEHYEIVIKKSSLNQPIFQLIYELINSNEFKEALEGLGGYDITDTGRIVSET